ncbi:hypothetical protein H0H81_001924 [Sphagnurus paluster]|uniref:Uncharacterized protein n=1 Tax=Sphagnurus paluster TaxID=117069 RepID=A0A9P7FVL4_9AGAR|nr:hypothetical protein H0H81_001924 [Sphagnurus paluster]
MLFGALFVLSYLAAPSASASPLPDLIDDSSPSCDLLGECRTMVNIISGCLATLFACTWISTHPNVPLDPDESLFKAAHRRIKLFWMAFIAPELIMLWAVRQWFSSRTLAQKHREYNWTQTHGFFADMGGFVECDNGTISRLDVDQLDNYLRRNEINITKEDIEDKSKGDFLSKLVVVLQVTWFMIHIIARKIQSLPITELEVATLAFALLNFIIYFCWWNKPLNVRRPLRRKKISDITSTSYFFPTL